MFICAIVLFLPILCFGKITINVTVASRDVIEIKFNGYDDKLVTERELQLYNLSDIHLKQGIKKELGKNPDDVYIKNPTPYGDLFKKQKWREVHRRLTIKSARIIEVATENVTLKVNNIINDSSDTVKMDVNLFQDVENTIYTLWNKVDIVADGVKYDLNAKFEDKLFHYENKWGNNNTRYLNYPYGVKQNGIININPGQKVVTKLGALKTLVFIEVAYSVALTGNVIANYAHVYGTYHFWAPTIESIMSAANLDNELIVLEKIELICYTNKQLEVYDKITRQNIDILSKNMKHFRGDINGLLKKPKRKLKIRSPHS